MVEVKVENYRVGVTFYRLTSLSFHVNRPSHSWDKAFSKFDLQNSRSNDQTIPQNFKWYKSIQQFQRYGFHKVWPKCFLIWQVFGPWASPYGSNGPWQCTTTGLDNSTELRITKIRQAVTGSASLAAARPPARPNCDNTPPARSAEG